MPSRPWKQARAIWPPEPGFFALALIRGGWEVPCRILVSAAGWQAEIDGALHPPDPEPAYAPQVARIWHAARIIDQSEYRWRSAVRDQASETCPDHPATNPKRRMDPRILAPLQPRTPR